MADGVDDPEEGDVEVGFGAGAAAFDGGDDLVDVEAVLPVEDADGDVDLGVADALAGEVAEHVVGDELVVGGGVEAGGDGFEAEQEAGEVVVGVDAAGFGEGEGSGVVALGELDEGFGGDGALEVEVELSFGKTAQPGFGVGLVGFGDLSGACHLNSLCAQGMFRRKARAGDSRFLATLGMTISERNCRRKAKARTEADPPPAAKDDKLRR